MTKRKAGRPEIDYEPKVRIGLSVPQGAAIGLKAMIKQYVALYRKQKLANKLKADDNPIH